MAEREATKARPGTLDVRSCVSDKPDCPGQGYSGFPFVSVIIPTYNREQILEKCLRALLDQTYPAGRCEIIVIDDGSTDGTRAMVERVSDEHRARAGFSPITYRYRKHTSISAARNEGINLARGELVIFLDSDIVTKPDFIEAHVRVHLQELPAIGHSGSCHDRRAGHGVAIKRGASRGSSADSDRRNRRGGAGLGTRRTPGRNPAPIEAQGTPPALLQGEESRSSGQLLGHDRIIVHGRVIYTTNLDNPTTEKKKVTDVSTAFFATTNVSIARRWLIEAGLFDEDFTEYGWEDLELGKRLKKLGLRVVRSDEPVGYHFKHEFSAENLPAIRRKEIERGHMAVLYHRKHPTFSVRMTTMLVPPFFWLVALLTPGGWPDRPGAARLLARLQRGGHKAALAVLLQVMVYYWYANGIKEALHLTRPQRPKDEPRR